jgi:anti-anti-sigma factor
MMTFMLPPALHLVRLPGAHGPILRCSGELSVATAEVLRRELALLEPLGHAVLTVSLTGCRSVDVDGLLTLLQTFKRLREKGRRLVLVLGTAQIARMLQFLGIDDIIPSFPTEEAAALALRGGGPPPPGPASWKVARSRTLARWRAIRAALEKAPREEILHHLTSMTALCERAEEVFQEDPRPEAAATAVARCQFCPLFDALGGRPEDVGCRSILDPIIEAVRSAQSDSARAQVDAVIRTIEEMPLPEGAEGTPGRAVTRE